MLSYQELLALLEATGAIDKLIQEGYNVTGAAAVGPTSEPIKSDSSSTLIGGVIGGSLGVLALAILISTIIIILLVNRRRQKRYPPLLPYAVIPLYHVPLYSGGASPSPNYIALSAGCDCSFDRVNCFPTASRKWPLPPIT